MSGVVQKKGEYSVTIQTDQHPERGVKGGGGIGAGTLMFSPTPIDRRDSETNGDESPIHDGTNEQAPEKKLTLFALRLAVLEKAASGLGTLGFVWATVVLLGGFAITLDKVDFLVITTILVIEGARIYSRSHELEWQHHATWSTENASWYSFRAIKSTLREFKFKSGFRSSPRDEQHGRRNQVAVAGDCRDHNVDSHVIHKNRRTWNTTEVPLLPCTGWVSLSKNISRLLYWLQLLSATACVTLSLTRLIKQDYGEFSKCDSDKRNRKEALNIFYSLALAEALLFLLEKAYWEWKTTFCDLLVEVTKACGFEEDTEAEMVPIKRFFYDAYSRCINGSIFDGLKMDLVSFSEELLASDSPDEQLIGARILLKFITDDKFAADTLRKIGTSTMTIERLVEMLNWKNPAEEELRMAAAEIVLKLAGKKQNTLRVAGIPGSMESISSLLYTAAGSMPDSRPHEICQRRAFPNQRDYEFSAFNRLGLQILKKLAHDHDNCGKIGNTRGLLQKVIDFTGNGERVLMRQSPTRDNTQINSMKYSLQLVKMLASTSGRTGKILRQELSDVVFTVGNIRDILQYGDDHMKLQKLAVEILTSLAMDEEARDRIGCTGGIIRELFVIFFRQGPVGKQNLVKVEAGEALMMLCLDSKANCDRILRLEVVDRLVEALNDPVLMKNSATILRNLCAYSGNENLPRLRGVVTAATPIVLKAVMHEEKKMLEVSIGLATQIFKFMSPEAAAEEFRKADIGESKLAQKLVKILSDHKRPCIDFPRIRRFAIELAIWMMISDEKNKWIFRGTELKKELENVADTTSELEFFIVFSGSAGLSPHLTTMYSLVDTALEILGNGKNG